MITITIELQDLERECKRELPETVELVNGLRISGYKPRCFDAHGRAINLPSTVVAT